MIQTTDDLIADIKLRAAVPTAQTLFTNARFLSLANAEMQIKIIPLVIKARENYYEYDIDAVATASDGLYPISTRAYLGLLSNVALLDDTTRYDLPLLSENDEIDTVDSRIGRPGIVLKRNTVQLKPATGHNFDTLRMTIILRPGLFVLEEAAAQITAISSTTLTFAASTIPTTWTASNTFDLIQNNPHYDHLGIDLSVSSVGATTIVLSSTPSSRLAVGDWISLAGESSIIQVPEAFSYLLSQRVAVRCLESLGHTDRAMAEMKIAMDMEKELMNSIQPRVQKEAKKIVNRTGMLRRSYDYGSW